MSNYFDNDVVQGWIVEYIALYKPYEQTIKDERLKAKKGGYVFNETEFFKTEVPETERIRMEILKEKIFAEVIKIINGIIFTHKFTIWEAYDDLFQEASEACIKAMPKFDPTYVTSNGTYATAFNYFSLTAKRCLKFYTIRNKKNRNHQAIDDYQYLTSEQDEFSRDIVSDNFIRQTRLIFENKKYKKFIPLVDILDEYLLKIQDYNKRDFFRFAKSNGWSPNLIRKFLKIIKDNKDDFYTENETV